MIKIRIPQKEISTFKNFCKVFSLHLNDQTGTRLRGNVLLNLMARAAGHDSYTALIIDAKTYGNGKMSWEALPNQLCSQVASDTGLSPSQCLSSLCFALLVSRNKADQQTPDLLEAHGNRFFANRANALLSSLIPALSDLNDAGEITINQETILGMSTYNTYCGLLNRSELSETSKSALQQYISSCAEFDSEKPLHQQVALEKRWGFSQAYMTQALRVNHGELRQGLN